MPQISPLPPQAPDAMIAIEQADIAVAEKASALGHDPAIEALGAASEMADQPPLIALSIAVVAVGVLSRRPNIALVGTRMIAAHLLATGMKTVIKRSVDRTRPHVLANEGEYIVRRGHSHESRYNSFPSGHTAGAVAVAEAIARSAPRAAWPVRVWAAAIAAIQIPRCAHYPSDIAAGALIGLAADRLVRLAEAAVRNRLAR